MQFLVLGYDGTDDKALERRLAARDAHIALGDSLRDTGNLLYGAAILDDGGKMIGSVLIASYPSRNELDAWLEIEPYVIGKVWERVEVQSCRVGPSFEKLKLVE